MLKNTIMSKSTPNFERHCGCFASDDHYFFTHSFMKPKARVQQFEKKDGEIFIRESRPKKKTWMPRSTSNVDFFDPLHKAALRFLSYLNESDGDEGELLKIRPMHLTFHLDDETFSMSEPRINDSGHIQGRVFYRQKVPREKGFETIGSDVLSWRDICVGKDVTMFGKTYRIVSCDEFTKNFYEDRGVEMNEKSETMPLDAWTLRRHFGLRKVDLESDATNPHNLHLNEDADLRSWENIPSTMTFNLVWLDTENDFHVGHVKRTFRMSANTVDDTVTLTETTPGFNNALFLRNERLPYITQSGAQRHYSVKHMRPGSWIEVFRRPMFIYDCEGKETTKFIRQQYGETRFSQCTIDILKRGPPPEQFHVRPSQLLFYAQNPIKMHVENQSYSQYYALPLDGPLPNHFAISTYFLAKEQSVKVSVRSDLPVSNQMIPVWRISQKSDFHDQMSVNSGGFRTKMHEFPKMDFILAYGYNTRRIDIFEAGHFRAWTKARPFLLDVDAAHIDVKNLRPGCEIALFRWHFRLTKAHPSTKSYLDSLEFQPSTTTSPRIHVNDDSDNSIPNISSGVSPAVGVSTLARAYASYF